jgi:hypothetical protein
MVRRRVADTAPPCVTLARKTQFERAGKRPLQTASRVAKGKQDRQRGTTPPRSHDHGNDALLRTMASGRMPSVEADDSRLYPTET